MLFFKKKLIPLHEFFPEGFVDIHSHLLPGIDDGAKDLNNSMELIQKMASFGIKHFITTPHILGNLYPNTPEIINRKLKIVKEELLQRNSTDIRIHAAAEYMLDEQFSEILEEGTMLTLKGNLVLVEMSYFSPPIHLFDLLFQLQLKGYKPVLAHPERYFSYHNNHKAYYQLKTAGCLFQLNFLSLTPHYGTPVEKAAQFLLKENMYDFVGTDTHHLQHLDLLQTISTKPNFKLLEPVMAENVRVFGRL